MVAAAAVQTWVFKQPVVGQTPIVATSAAPTTTVNTSTLAAGNLGTTRGAAGNSTPGRLGTIAQAFHPTFGEGEFIYLLGVVGTLPGLMVTYNATTWQTTIRPTTASNPGPIAVAMSANVASQYGWYQIAGLATILKTAVAASPQAAIYQSTTAGRVSFTSITGSQILGARGANLTTTTSTTSTVVVLINRPAGKNTLT
jgi:hypothetical protein